MKVSVYCLVYNHEKYLRDCLDGFVNQITNFEYEVIIHNDASTDNSKKIIEEYVEKYPKIFKPIYQIENQYSKDIDIISTYIAPELSGEYVAICEGDDYWCDNTKLQQQVDFLDNNPDYSACVHNTKCLNLFDHTEYVMFPEYGDRDILFLDVLASSMSVCHTSSVVYRSQYINNQPNFFTPAKKFGDYPLFVYLTLSGKVRFINKVMSVYRMGTEYSWTKACAVNIERTIEHFQSVVDMFVSIDEYTDYKYTEIIKENILGAQYNIEYFSGNYSKLRKQPYRKIYKSKNFNYKFKTYLKQYLDKPYQLYRKFKYK